jgi:gliding motility-associated-like protein
VIQLVNSDFDDVVTIPAEKNIVRKVVTPNNDGVNDFVVFEDITFYKAFPLNQVDNIKIQIFDLTGKIVREICDTEIWDGKDDTGNKVSAGVYIYQYKLGNEIKTGSIIIAR